MNQADINIEKLNLSIYYPTVDYLDWKYLINNINDIEKELESLLAKLDIKLKSCNPKFAKTKIITIDSFVYQNYINNYYWYLLHIDNPFKYNYYFNKLITLHEQNVKLHERTLELEAIIQKEKKTRSSAKSYKPTNKWFREDKVDLFTGKTTYYYYNPKTNESFTSDDPNKLEELNAKKVKVKKIKEPKDSKVPLSAMTFNFNKKI